MSIKDTYKHLKDLLSHVVADLEKSENGNKAASQRVRTGTVKLEKLAKLFRKESISFEKKNKGVKKSAKAADAKGADAKAVDAKAADVKKAATPGKSKTAAAPKGKAPVATKPKNGAVKAKPKATQAKTTVKARNMSVKRATAKLPTRRFVS